MQICRDQECSGVLEKSSFLQSPLPVELLNPLHAALAEL